MTPIRKADGDIDHENNYRLLSVTGHTTNMIELLVGYQIIEDINSFQYGSICLFENTLNTD